MGFPPDGVALMPRYAYKAADATGTVVKGLLEAAGERDVVARLQEMGCIPIQITPAAGRGPQVNWRALLQWRAAAELPRFTHEIATLLTAGLPVDRALAILVEASENQRFQDVVRDLLKSVQGGAYLSDALGRHPGIFSDFYVNMVRAGEVGGVLPPVLERLGVFLEASRELKQEITSALIYPLFLVFMGGASIIVLMTFVIPKFAVVFKDMGVAMPLSTQVLLTVSEAFRQYWWLLGLALAALGLAFRWYAGTPGGRHRVDALRLRLPLVRALTRKIEAARFSRTLGTLMSSGVPILTALGLVRSIHANSVVAGALETVRNRVREGDRLSRPLAEADIFPVLAVRMITVGEESGRLDAMLLEVARGYEKDTRETIKRMVGLLEPLLILFMGLVVGFIVISMLMAIFSMNDMPF